MPKKEIRFGIRNSQEKRAATWKLWTEGKTHSEIYLACRALGGALKTSFHQSGHWHTAYSPETFRNQVEEVIPEGRGRFIEKWERPPELAPGLTIAYTILTPATSVTSPIEAATTNKVKWLENPELDKATEILILISREPLTDTWPGKNTGMSYIGSFALNNGDTVWALSHIVPMPPIKHPGGLGGYFKGKSKADLAGGNLRAVVFADGDGGRKIILDVAVKVSRRLQLIAFFASLLRKVGKLVQKYHQRKTRQIEP